VYGKTNAATIPSIHVYKITCKVDFLNQVQVKQMAHTIALPFNKCVSESARTRFATATMIVRKKNQLR
jgi:hypothetical protein